MKPQRESPTLVTRLCLGAFLLGATCLATPNAWARLPRPIQANGIVLAVDPETQVLVFKTAPEKKPFVLDWNKDTKFMKNGRPASPTEFARGSSVVLIYRRVSFRNPLLKQVIWEEHNSSP